MDLTKHPLFVAASVLVAAFGAGWFAYAEVKKVTQAEVAKLEVEIAEVKEQNAALEAKLHDGISVIKKDCEQIEVPGGTATTKACPKGKVMMGLSQQYHDGAFRNWVHQIECCAIQ